MDNDFKSSVLLNDTNKSEEVNVPEVVANLKMLTVDEPEEEEVSSTCQRRSLRKRKIKNYDLTNLNRRCSLRPKKRTFLEMESEDQIKEYYLDKTVKKNTHSLETIFEEKEDLNQASTYMSVKRFKRMIQFTPQPTESKIKKRREKVKRIFGSKINHRKKRYASMQALLDKLGEIKQNAEIL